VIRATDTRGRVVLAIALMFATLWFVPHPFILPVLLATWLLLLRPFSAADLARWVIAALFFLIQNYLALKDGLFEFRHKEILLMPHYEPLLWGFYFLAITRLVGPERGAKRLDWRAVLGLVVTSSMFSLFGRESHQLFLATSASTALLLAMFHERSDWAYALTALGLGAGVELLGVSSGLWRYPEPDVLGIPFWFATMWLSVGLLGRRFLSPVADWVAARLMGAAGQRP